MNRPSQTFISMCKEQQLFKNNSGVNVYLPLTNTFGQMIGASAFTPNQIKVLLNDFQTIEVDYSNVVIIPTIEQLLEMITIDMLTPYIKYTTMDTHIDSNRLIALNMWQDTISTQRRYSDYAHYIVSLSFAEQLLCFIMYHKHKKEWDFQSSKWKEI